jgi:hypothetical protein
VSVVIIVALALASVRSNLLSVMILFRIGDNVD